MNTDSGLLLRGLVVHDGEIRQTSAPEASHVFNPLLVIKLNIKNFFVSDGVYHSMAEYNFCLVGVACNVLFVCPGTKLKSRA